MKRLIFCLVLLVSCFLPVTSAHAQAAATDICLQIRDAAQQTACTTCVTNAGHVWTAIGCFNAGDPKEAISSVLGWAVVLGFGIAFLMGIFAGFQLMTSAGDAKRAKAAQELLTAAISGLLLIVFSVLLLNFIGFTIFNLPGFTI